MTIQRFEDGDPTVVQTSTGYWRRPCMNCGKRIAHLEGEAQPCSKCGVADGWMPTQELRTAS